MTLVSSDGMEIAIPGQLVAHSSILRRQFILGPITMHYTGEELSNAIATYTEYLSTGERCEISSKVSEILEEMGLGDLPERHVRTHHQAACLEADTEQEHMHVACPYHNQIRSTSPRDLDSANNITNVTNLPLITSEQFLANDGSDGHRLWILIDTIVFDVTGYLNKHPGGKAPLLKGAKKDSTLQFYQHHGRKGNTRPLFNRLRSLAVGRMSLSELQRVPGYQKLDTEGCGNPSLRRQFLQYFHVIE